MPRHFAWPRVPAIFLTNPQTARVHREMKVTLVLSLFACAGSVLADAPALGGIPQGAPERILPRSRDAGSGLTIDRTNREAVIRAYQQYYRKYRTAVNGWTGSVNGCRVGSNSTSYDGATLELLRYFRAMAGVPSDVSFSDNYNKAAQAAALIMEAKGDLNHNPPANWPCYSEAGKKGASSSNLCLGCVGPSAIEAYVDDGNVKGVGHRRWALAPGQKVLGTGSSKRAHALYVFGDWRPEAEVAHIREVAWPPSGFVPMEFGMSPDYPWSYQRHDRGADLSNARMTLSQGGRAISVRIDSNDKSQVVVYPTGLPKPSRENNYNRTTAANGYRVDVKIENARIDGKLQTVSYSVTFIDGETSVSEATEEETQPQNEPVIPADVELLSRKMLAACYEGNAPQTKDLLQRGANPNAQNNGWTGLMYAAYFGHRAVVDVLLTRNADPNIKMAGWTAAALARKRGHAEIADLLDGKTRDRGMPPGLLPGLP